MKQYPSDKTKKQSRLRHLGLMLCMLPNLVFAQEDIIMFHNCENLFYPLNDSLTEDDDFTVEGKKHWTFKRYNAKLNALAKTYISVDEKMMPSIIGLVEVENDTVLDALTKDTPLRKVGYKYIHYPSKDIRGIDVALLYNPKRFLVEQHYVLPTISDKEQDRTRDVLYVKGVLNKLNINIYVVHAPSRRENNIKKHLRQEIFSQIYNHIESLKEKGEDNFLVMGDFNDNPWDETVLEGFHIKTNSSDDSALLYDLMMKNKNTTGSYVYSGTYLSFDQFLLTKSLKDRLLYDEFFNSTHVYKPSFLINKDRSKRLDIPFSTYKGYYYQGGVSDHFPIIMKLKTE
ncbi:MAG: hypothetical protein KBT03_07395 [Bacteroidales bacterium]|nr:hypothetical protein [Candidatus Scybalousia scybalohippi]